MDFISGSVYSSGMLSICNSNVLSVCSSGMHSVCNNSVCRLCSSMNSMHTAT